MNKLERIHELEKKVYLQSQTIEAMQVKIEQLERRYLAENQLLNDKVDTISDIVTRTIKIMRANLKLNI